jgi:tripartite-type tricarboxylate transporter receptor subunit TctC
MQVHRRYFLQDACGAAAVLAFPAIARSENYPVRPVRFIVGFAAGSTSDILARLMGQWLSGRFGQQFVVENRPGAGGNVGAETLVNAPADGYTLLLVPPAVAANPTLYEHLSFDFIRDTAPVGGVVRVPNVVEVHPSIPVKTVPELIAYAKANPGKLSYAGVGVQTVTAIAAGVLKARAGLDMTLVPYKGGVQAVGDLIAGHVDMYFGNASEMLPHLDSGKIKLLAVATPQRIPQAPNLPAVAETLPGFQFGSWNGFMVPAGTPQQIIDKLVAGSIEAVNTPAVREKLVQSGIVPGGTTPAQVAERFKADKKAFAEAVEIMGLKPE